MYMQEFPASLIDTITNRNKDVFSSDFEWNEIVEACQSYINTTGNTNVISKDTCVYNFVRLLMSIDTPTQMDDNDASPQEHLLQYHRKNAAISATSSAACMAATIPCCISGGIALAPAVGAGLASVACGGSAITEALEYKDLIPYIPNGQAGSYIRIANNRVFLALDGLVGHIYRLSSLPHVRRPTLSYTQKLKILDGYVELLRRLEPDFMSFLPAFITQVATNNQRAGRSLKEYKAQRKTTRQ